MRCDGIKMCHININSLSTKIDHLRFMLKNHPFHVISVSETHCDDTITDQELSLDGFTILRKDRNRNGGGVALYIHNSLAYTKLDYGSEIETLWVKLKLDCGNYVSICVTYRPPNCSVDFFDKFSNMMEEAILDVGEIVVLGDFNCDVMKSNEDCNTKLLQSAMDGFLFSQLIDLPTRVTVSTQTLIDHIYSTNPEKHSLSGVFTTTVSDHYLIFTIYDELRSTTPMKTIQWRDFKHFEHGKFVDTLNSMAFDSIFRCTSVDTALELWHGMIMEAFVVNAPMKSKRLKSNPCPWVSGDVIQLMNTRDYYHKKAIQTNSVVFWNRYRYMRNLVNSKLKQEKKKHFDSLLCKNAGNPGALWKTLKSLTNSTQHDEITLDRAGDHVTDPKKVAEEFNEYFINSVNELITDSFQHDDCENYTTLKHNDAPIAEREQSSDLFELPIVTSDYVRNEIRNLTMNKATGCDDISVKLLKLISNIDIVIDSFTYICNLSLSTGHFPKTWKIARVKPIFKTGNKLQVSNYRPIAILSVASKFIERAVHKHFLSYLISKEIMCPNQFGFRPNHSCETALLCMVDEWAMNVDNGKINGVAVVDLRRAFDLVDHIILLQLLADCGSSEKSIQWFQSYLSNREQFVSIQNEKSGVRNVSAGVPQGSILGPLLFTLMINNLPKAVSNGTVYMYADDTTITVSGNSKQEIEDKLNLVLKEVYDWTVKHKLLMNLKKTKVMMISTKQRCRNLLDTSLNVKLNNVTIECVTETKCLGVMLDSQLTFHSHITSIAKVIKQKIGVLRRSRNPFDSKQLSYLYWGYVLPHILYCANVWSGRSNKNYDILCKLHKRAAYMVSKQSWLTPSNEVLSDLSWPSLDKLFWKASCCMMFKCVNQLTPEIVYEKLKFIDDIKRRPTRGTGKMLLRPPQCRTEFYKRSFFVSACEKWNNLPLDIKQAPSIHTFKKRLNEI